MLLRVQWFGVSAVLLRSGVRQRRSTTRKTAEFTPEDQHRSLISVLSANEVINTASKLVNEIVPFCDWFCATVSLIWRQICRGIKRWFSTCSVPVKWFGLRLAFLEESSTERSTTFSGQLWCQWTRAVAKVFYCLEIVGSKQDGPHRALLVPAGNFWWVFLRLILLIWGERRMSSVAAVADVKGMMNPLPADARIIFTVSLHFNFNLFFSRL